MISRNKDQQRLIVSKPSSNSFSAWKLGLAARGSPPIDSAGMAGFILMADMEPPSHEMLDLFANVEFLAVAGPYMPGGIIEHKANVLIPLPTWVEKDGDYTSMDGKRTACKRKIFDPPDGVPGFHAVLVKLARSAGLILKYQSMDQIRKCAWREISGNGPAYIG